MRTPTKATPWLNLAAGLLWLLAIARDLWMPGFLSISGGHRRDDAIIWFGSVSAALFLFAACRGFMRMRSDSAL